MEKAGLDSKTIKVMKLFVYWMFYCELIVCKFIYRVYHPNIFGYRKIHQKKDIAISIVVLSKQMKGGKNILTSAQL